MHLRGPDLVFAATDLSNFLACSHLTSLDRAAALGEIRKPHFDDPGVEAIRHRGHEHEQLVLAHFRASGSSIVEPAQPTWTGDRRDWECGAASTLEAMRSGADIIYQATLFDGTWAGRPDFLRRVDRPSALGGWSYEVIDAKLAREAKAGAVLQIGLYSDLLTNVQGTAPEEMHLALGEQQGELESFRVADYAAYFRWVRERFLAAVAEPPNSYPEPVDHCDVCDWHAVCRERWRKDDHLSLVAGITKKQRQKLQERGVQTVEALAGLSLRLEPRLENVSDAAFARFREQARIQVEGRRAERTLYELLPHADDVGLASLPEPSDGDIFFDIEGDPYALKGGLEYLLGWVDVRGDYQGLWALDRESERRRFEDFIDFVMARWKEHPGLHVYHFAPYEPTALKRLMGRYGTREEEVDQLLRGDILVDLYDVVRKSLRASVESYSIKRLEPLYQFSRAVDLKSASSALANFEAWLQMGAKSDEKDVLLAEIEGYNRDDCLSTLRLRNWLEERRIELATKLGREIPRPTPPDPNASENVEEQAKRVQELFWSLTSDVPADAATRSADQQARWILANLLSFHRREKKSTWWEYFRCLKLEGDELIQDRSTLGGLEYDGVVDTVKRSDIHRYRFPPQDHALRVGAEPTDPATKKSAGEIVALSDDECTIDLKRGKRSEAPHPAGLVPFDDVRDEVLQESLLRLASSIAELGLEGTPNRAAADLLRRIPPRVGQAAGAPLVEGSEDVLSAARSLALALDNSVLPVQGPPGAGKTYTGARMIVALLREGRRVGVTATGHKVISNLLAEVKKAAADEGVALHGVQKADEEDWCGLVEIERAADNAKVVEMLASGEAQLAAGTAWLWSREDMAHSVDVLFVDEAGQMSLANTLAVSQAAKSLVLLGDPRQLEQPRKGVHPDGTDVSALDHLVGATTVSPDRGLFLDQTWRLHPDICSFTSELYYDGRLESRNGLDVQKVAGSASLAGSGLRFVAVHHSGNTTESVEEVDAVRRLVEGLTTGGVTWIDAWSGQPRPLTLNDILVVAPYNAQVALLRGALPRGARVGTVDKFQGQEAAVVIFSPTSSSAEDAPRGMEFLYSPNRLNVATSRARCLAIIVGSPALFGPMCKSPKQMRLANGFCRFLEMAGVDP